MHLDRTLKDMFMCMHMTRHERDPGAQIQNNNKVKWCNSPAKSDITRRSAPQQMMKCSLFLSLAQLPDWIIQPQLQNQSHYLSALCSIRLSTCSYQLH